MPALSPRNLAYDPVRARTYVTAVHGKAKYLLSLDPDTMEIAIVRTFTAPPDNAFWVRDGVAVFWGLGRTIVTPLDEPAAKAKTLKMPSENAAYNLHAAVVPEPTGLFAVLGDSVHRFDQDRWTAIDGAAGVPEATVVRATQRGTFVRPLGGAVDAWQPLVEGTATRATLAVSGRHALVSGHGASSNVVIGLDGSNPTPVAVGNWCAVGHDRGFFAWQDRKVLDIGLDGTVRDTEITKHDEAADRCLFRAGDAIYFVQRKFIHRHRDGVWTKHDLAAAGVGIGLV